jgi:predicted dehydrogenase
MPPVRLGVIGAGRIWIRTHQAILASLADAFQPVAFCDASAERRESLAAEFPGAPIVADAQELLALPAVDAVLVLTPLALNAPIALAALRAGKDVLMEKPIARSVAEAQALIDTARQAGRRLFVTEQYGYGHTESMLAELLGKHSIGDVLLWERIQHWLGEPTSNPLSYAASEWRQQADFPLGTLFDGGIHPIASLSTVFGAPSSVYATGRKLRQGYGAYDHVTMTFQYADGAVGTLSYSECMSPANNHFHVHGTQGVISVERRRLVVERTGQPRQEIEVPSEDNYRAMWRGIAQAFHEPGAPIYSAEMALRDVAILEAVDRSIASGLPVQIVT